MHYVYGYFIDKYAFWLIFNSTFLASPTLKEDLIDLSYKYKAAKNRKQEKQKKSN